MGLRTTHTYVHLAVKQSTFDDVRDRLINAYPEGMRHEAEHYLLREREFHTDTPVVGCCLGEVMLIVEGGPLDKD